MFNRGDDRGLIVEGALTLSNEIEDRARLIIEQGTPMSTLCARQSARRYFWSWAGLALKLEEGYPVAGETLVRFCTDHLSGLSEEIDRELVRLGIKAKLGPHSVATVEARVSHLSALHVAQGLENPARDPRVVEILKAARRLRARKVANTRRPP